MLRIIIILVILLGSSIVGWPWAFEKFSVWDAANPEDDQSTINELLLPLTPASAVWMVKQNIELNSGGIIIDVRTKQEYDEAHIPGAISVPQQTLYEEIPKLYADKNKTYYLYGDTGYTGAVATRLLRSMGYERAFNIEGGLSGWKKSGNKIDSLYYFPE